MLTGNRILRRAIGPVAGLAFPVRLKWDVAAAKLRYARSTAVPTSSAT